MIKKGIKRLADKLLAGAFLLPSTVGKYGVYMPVKQATKGIAKYGKLKSDKSLKTLQTTLFVADCVGLAISATPFLITALPYLCGDYSKESAEKNGYLEIEEIIKNNREDN